MKLRLARQGEFLGTKCDFYADENNRIYMSRTQIGYALNYKNPQDSIKKIHLRHFEQLEKRYIEVVGDNLSPRPKGLGKKTSIFMYDERGILDVIRWSTSSVADNYFDWVYDVISEIKKNGYYIAAKKDEKWLGIRQETKKVRNEETDMIKKFISYAEKQGSSHASNYYMLLTNVANNRCGIKSGERDKADQKTLLRLKSLETLIEMRLETLMNKNMPYKEVFRGVKELIENI